jgi:hypothetical protein
MLDLDPNIVLHKLLSIQGCKLMKQKLKRMRPNILIKIEKKKVQKQFEAGFLEAIQYLS